MRRAYFLAVFPLAFYLFHLSARSNPSAGFSKIYVVSTIGNTALSAYTPDGQPAFPVIALGGCSCNGVAVDASGRIFITENTGTTPMVAFNSDGRPVANPIPRFGPAAMGISIGPAGAFYVLAPDAHGKLAVDTFTSSGNRTLPFVQFGPGPASFTVDKAGKIYIASQLGQVVKIYRIDGKDTGVAITSGLQAPRAVAVGPDGKIYVANLLNVTSYLPTGQQTNVTITHQSPTGPDQPFALAVDASGKIYIGYYGRGGVGVYNPDGSPVTYFPTPRGVTAIALH